MGIESKDHQDVAEPDQIASGAAGTGQENEELKWMRKHSAKTQGQADQKSGQTESGTAGGSTMQHAPKLVERRTGLRGQTIGSASRPKQSMRGQIEKELISRDSDVPYNDAEKANRNLVCSLIERQDRVVEQLLLQINDLQYRIDDLELAVADFTKRPVDTETEGAE